MEKLVDGIKWLKENISPDELVLEEHTTCDLGADGIFYHCTWNTKKPSEPPVRIPIGKLPDGWDLVQVPGEIPYPFDHQDGYLLAFIGPKYICDYVRLIVEEYQAAAQIIRDAIEV